MKVCSLGIWARHSMIWLHNNQKRGRAEWIGSDAGTIHTLMIQYIIKKVDPFVVIISLNGLKSGMIDWCQCQWRRCASVRHRKRCIAQAGQKSVRAHIQMHVCTQACTRSRDRVASETRKKEPNSYGLFGEGSVSAPKRSWLVSLIHASSYDWSLHGELFKFCKRIPSAST